MKQNVISQGAEAILIKKRDIVLKKRIKKNYRHHILDNFLRKIRTRKEIRLLKKASLLIHVPKIKKISEEKKEIEIEFINGKLVSSYLNKKNYKKICYEIGKSIALLHSRDIIHGDLTTSNMIFKNNKIFFIDFGLGFFSSNVEDKAVDLHLLKQALESKHFNIPKAFNEILKAYKKFHPESEKILKRLEKVELRGRYKMKKIKRKPYKLFHF